MNAESNKMNGHRKSDVSIFFFTCWYSQSFHMFVSIIQTNFFIYNLIIFVDSNHLFNFNFVSHNVMSFNRLKYKNINKLINYYLKILI